MIASAAFRMDARRPLVGLACVLVLALLVVWQGTPRLDWARYRQGISAFATARLGRDVTIGGPIHLALLPHPELTAQDVTLADRGDGISARLGALRLTVAIGPLLRGHLVPLSLQLDDPDVTVPWPLPGGAPGPVPAVARGFGAQLEGGTLHLGGLTLQSVQAQMHDDPDSGAFSAAGTMTVGGGAQVRFSAFIGAPGQDGVATVSLTLEGQDRLSGTGAAFHGHRRADGGIMGILRADGPDASRLLPAPALPWRVDGPVQADASLISAPSFLVQLGGSPGDAKISLRLAPAARLDADLKLGQLPLGAWLAEATTAAPALPIHLNFSASAAGVGGGTLREARAALLVTPHGVVVETATAILPGGAPAQFSGTIEPDRGRSVLAGKLHVQVPDVSATLAWLRTGLPSSLQLLRPGFARQAEFAADISLSSSGGALGNMRLTLDGASLLGEASLVAGATPVLRANLRADSLDATVWPAALLPRSPAAITGAFRHFDAGLHLEAGRLALPFVTLGNLSLDAVGGPRGVSIDHLTADLPGAHLDAGGKLAPDGEVADGRLNLDANEAAALPPSWRRLPGLWHGPMHLALNVGGPAQKVAVQLRCDVGDLRAELEGALDTPAWGLVGTATLRHPGAPRLLQEAGIADAGRWLEQGSVAVIVHFAARPGHLEARDFSVAAASLHFGGTADVDYAGPVPVLNAAIEAPRLALPSFDPRGETPLPLGQIGAWQAQVHLAGDEVLFDLSPFATSFKANFVASGGVLALDGVTASAAGGTLQGAAVLDSAAPVLMVRGAAQGLALNNLDMLPPWTWRDGTADASLDLTATGYSPAALVASLAGTATGDLHGAVLEGVDVAEVTRLLAARGAKLRANLVTAMTTGDTGRLAGPFTASVDHGALDMAARGLTGDAGEVDLTALLDVPARTEDATVRVRPLVTAPPTISVRQVGGWQQPRRVVDVADAVGWAEEGNSSFLKKTTKKLLK